MRSPCTPVKSRPRSPQWEKAYMQQWRSSTAKKKKTVMDKGHSENSGLLMLIISSLWMWYLLAPREGVTVTTGLGTSKTVLIRMLRFRNKGWNPGGGGHLICLHRTSLRTAFQPCFQDLEAMNDKTSVKKIRKLILKIWLKEARS